MVRKRPAFDRIQVDVLVRIATAAARMVGIGATRLGGMVKNDPTLNVGSGVLVSVFVGQHDRQHTRDDGFSICALDIRLLIQIDLEKDRVAFSLERAKVMLFVRIVRVTKVVEYGDGLDDACRSLFAEGGYAWCHYGDAGRQILSQLIIERANALGSRVHAESPGWFDEEPQA